MSNQAGSEVSALAQDRASPIADCSPLVISAAALAPANAQLSSSADSSIISTATRAPGPNVESMKSIVMASSSKA